MSTVNKLIYDDGRTDKCPKVIIFVIDDKLIYYLPLSVCTNDFKKMKTKKRLRGKKHQHGEEQ